MSLGPHAPPSPTARQARCPHEASSLCPSQQSKAQKKKRKQERAVSRRACVTALCALACSACSGHTSLQTHVCARARERGGP